MILKKIITEKINRFRISQCSFHAKAKSLDFRFFHPNQMEVKHLQEFYFSQFPLRVHPQYIFESHDSKDERQRLHQTFLV